MGANVGIFLERKKAATVVDEIWAQLRRLILQGTLVPGTRLVELDIAAQTGASQGSVREALQRLERDGLVVRWGRNGTFVTEVSPAEMHEIFRIRGVVESCAIRRLARRVRPEQLEELRELVERMREAGRRGTRWRWWVTTWRSISGSVRGRSIPSCCGCGRCCTGSSSGSW